MDGLIKEAGELMEEAEEGVMMDANEKKNADSILTDIAETATNIEAAGERAA